MNNTTIRGNRAEETILPPGERADPSSRSEQPAHDHARDDHHQPVDEGFDTDRAGQNDAPELDNMDEDRGV